MSAKTCNISDKVQDRTKLGYYSGLMGTWEVAVFVLMTPPLFHPNFGVFPLDQIVHVGVNLSR